MPKKKKGKKPEKLDDEAPSKTVNSARESHGRMERPAIKSKDLSSFKQGDVLAWKEDKKSIKVKIPVKGFEKVNEKPVHSTSALTITISDRELRIEKNQKRPTTHQLHLLTRLINAEMRMLLRKGYFDDMERLSVSYRVEKRQRL